MKDLLSGQKSRHLPLLACALLALATIAAYWPLRLNTFINFDNAQYITGNCNVQRALTLESIAWAFRFNNISYWHPVTWISLLVDYQLFGLKPVGYHMMNLFFHYCNAALLFLILYRTTGFAGRSFSVALLFALNPINVEAVAWAVERKTVLSAFFWMLSVHAYLYHAKRPSAWRLGLVAMVFAFGLMAKAAVVTLPCILLLLDYWPLRRTSAENAASPTGMRGAMYLLMEKMPLFLLSLCSTGISIISVRGGGGVAETVGTPLGEKIANAIVSYATYPFKIAWPTKLSVYYPIRHTYPLWEISAALFFVAMLTVLALVKAKKYPWFPVSWFWYVMSILPAIGLVRGGLWPEMADRFAYIPSIGLYLLVVWGCCEAFARYRPGTKAFAVVLAGAALFYGSLTYVQTGYWRNSISLFEHARTVSGETATFYRGIAGEYFERGEYDKALQLGAKVVELEPESSELDLAEALIAQKREDFERAAEFAQKILLGKEDSLAALFVMGEVSEHRGATRDAIRFYNQVLHSPQEDDDRYHCRAQDNLNRLLVAGLPQVDLLRRAVSMNPSSIPARKDLALQLDDLAFYEEALQHYLILEQAGFQDGQICFNIGRLYSKLQKPAQAVSYFQRALEFNPGNLAALNEVGLFYLEKKRYAEAVSSFEKAMALNPQYALAPYNLGMAYLGMKNKPKALQYFNLVAERFPEFRPRVKPYLAELRRPDK